MRLSLYSAPMIKIDGKLGREGKSIQKYILKARMLKKKKSPSGADFLSGQLIRIRKMK